MLTGFENPVLSPPFLNPDEFMIKLLISIVSSSKKGLFLTKYSEYMGF